jgi:hypothetical protein
MLALLHGLRRIEWGLVWATLHDPIDGHALISPSTALLFTSERDLGGQSEKSVGIFCWFFHRFMDWLEVE